MTEGPARLNLHAIISHRMAFGSWQRRRYVTSTANEIARTASCQDPFKIGGTRKPARCVAREDRYGIRDEKPCPLLIQVGGGGPVMGDLKHGAWRVRCAALACRRLMWRREHERRRQGVGGLGRIARAIRGRQ